MNNIKDGFAFFIMPIVFLIIGCGVLGVFVSALLFSSAGEETIESFKKQAIENNCGQYNPTNGKFEWINHE